MKKLIIRTFSVLICTFPLLCAARGETGHKKQTTHATASQRVPTKTPQHVATHAEHPAAGSAHVQRTQAPQHVASPGGHPAIPAGRNPAQLRSPAHLDSQGGRPQTATAVQPPAQPITKEQQDEVYAHSQGFRSAEQYRKWKETGRVEIPEGVATSGAPAGEHGVTAAGSGAVGSHTGVHPFPSRHFDLPNTPRSRIKNVKFQPGSHIPECEKWRDSRYNTFRNYTATWHDADWWRRHHSRIVFVSGGWYYWNTGYWFPAWGYHPEAVYAYDGPIYAYSNLDPDQVVANVQATLQDLGYYHGPVNGVLESATRAAIANYQRDHGLYTTSTIDEPTLVALGMA
jgi:putative peptidoglycan binding protein